MGLNPSKIRDERFWNRWKNSGAIPLKLTVENKPEIINMCKKVIKKMGIIVEPATDNEMSIYKQL